MALPSLGLAHRIEVGTAGGAPLPDHATPRYRIFAKQPRQLRREQERSELDVGVSSGPAMYVVARRLQVRVLAMAGTAKAFEEHELKLISLEDLEILVGRFEKPGEIAAQKWKLQICRDADRFSQPMTDELLDDAVGHDDRDALERIAPLMIRDRQGERRDQIFQSI